jgi:tRNA (guanine37-N1)-methyltransferase
MATSAPYTVYRSLRRAVPFLLPTASDPLNACSEDTLSPVKISVITMFPEYFESPLEISLIGKAIERGLLEIALVDLRLSGRGVHRQLDDAPFGGGAGMVMLAEPLGEALAPLADTHRVLLTPSGTPLTQATLDRWATGGPLTLVCGRYEGVDQRAIDAYIDEETSLGDYVLLGGEAGALAIIEGVVRLLPGVVGNPESTRTESFRDGLLEEPQYTRPAEYEGVPVPEVLLSGNHARIDEWRLEQREERTRSRRPDLWTAYVDRRRRGEPPS